MTTLAVGVDIGGTGIKGAIVDVSTGELTTDRIKKATPEGGKPHPRPSKPRNRRRSSQRKTT